MMMQHKKTMFALTTKTEKPMTMMKANVIMMKTDCGGEGEGGDDHEEERLTWTKQMTTNMMMMMLKMPTIMKKANPPHKSANRFAQPRG